MKYRAGERRKAVEYEKALTEWWKKNKIFEQSIEQRPADKSYVFYDGPPFITGLPHHGTLLSSIVKDAVPRYFQLKISLRNNSVSPIAAKSAPNGLLKITLSKPANPWSPTLKLGGERLTALVAG